MFAIINKKRQNLDSNHKLYKKKHEQEKLAQNVNNNNNNEYKQFLPGPINSGDVSTVRGSFASTPMVQLFGTT